MTDDRPTNTPSAKVPGRGDYKGLYRSDPAALTTEQPGDVLPPVSIGLSDLLGGIDGTDHGRRRVYNLSDDTHGDEAQVRDAQDDTNATDDADDDAGAVVLTAEADDADAAEGLEL